MVVMEVMLELPQTVVTERPEPPHPSTVVLVVAVVLRPMWQHWLEVAETVDCMEQGAVEEGLG